MEYRAVLAEEMSQPFNIRLATAADAGAIAWHRARMFQDMGEVPPEMFEALRAKSFECLHQALTEGEYVGWLAIAATSPATIVGGAGVALRDVLPHPLVRSTGAIEIAQGRHGIILNVFTEPEWRRRGIAACLLERIIDWARAEQLDRLVLHASNEGRGLYQRLGFVATNEMRFAEETKPS
jgi:GNAT superfamily N-acetyltransferase